MSDDNGKALKAVEAAPQITSMRAKLMLEGDLTKYYNAVSMSIASSIPPEFDTPMTVTNIMAAIMSGALQCWALIGKAEGEESPRFIGTATTQIVKDSWLNKKSLLIYTMQSYQHVDITAWKDAFSQTKKFARENGCTSINVVTNNNPRTAMIAEAMGMSPAGAYTMEVR